MYDYLNPYQQNMYNGGLNALQSVSKPRYEIIQVSGKNGAEAFNLAPNSSVLLLDQTQPIVWLKKTDGAGYPTITPYTISPYQEAPPVDVKSLEDRITAIEQRLEKKDEPNIKQPKQK